MCWCWRREQGKNILSRGYRDSTFFEKHMGTPRKIRENRAGHRKDLTVVVERQKGSNETPAFFGRLYNERSKTQASNNAVAHREVTRTRDSAGWKFGYQGAVLGDLYPQTLMCCWGDTRIIDAAS
jgi:hypothetical protein